MLVGLPASAWLILRLTVPLSSLRWQSCWDPRLCRGTGRCPQECAVEGRSPAGTGFPGERERERGEYRMAVHLNRGQSFVAQTGFISFRGHRDTGGCDSLWWKHEAGTGRKNEKQRRKGTFFGSMLNFFRPMAICLFLWHVLLQHTKVPFKT